jgi:anti-anti-sigma factor
MAVPTLSPLADITEAGGVTVVTFRELRLRDGRCATDALAEVVQPLVAENPGRRLALDMAAIDFLPSHSLGKLIVIRKAVDAAGGGLVLCGLRPDVRDVFNVTGLERLFRFAPDVGEGVRSLGGTPPAE